MGIQESLIPTHWNYFLSLEDDIDRLSRFIEFTKKNFDCFSLELARVLLTASSEVDVVAKQYCKSLDAKSKAQSIGKYKIAILEGNPGFPDTVIKMPRFGLTFTPWSSWNTEEVSPHWWQSNNKVKHQRHTHFDRANLKNTLNSVAGLFSLLIHYYKHQIDTGQYIIDHKTFKHPELFHDGMYLFQ
ncbi:MAG: hypothetical protein RPU51_04520 [Candidatus Sedimenticola sp. (ex Thyasira tokunagai)]